ncbi:hypothetical protein [Cloacibacillus evryensis]|uniref:hypothetical protein n=1 Tax=Cloacibacillus evryensis TaxID=508460 RepID=UPI0021099DED|nr:hypothetical protein [Cloacibacillus evryensis]MCQ4764989.1 hypothetical protein [Cloacibacillus evryensis]
MEDADDHAVDDQRNYQRVSAWHYAPSVARRIKAHRRGDGGADEKQQQVRHGRGRRRRLPQQKPARGKKGESPQDKERKSIKQPQVLAVDRLSVVFKIIFRVPRGKNPLNTPQTRFKHTHLSSAPF